YPWMQKPQPTAATAVQLPGMWRISFTQAGLPLRVERVAQPTTAGKVTVLQESKHSLPHLTHRLLTGTRQKPKLSSSGERLIQLLTHQPPPVTAPPGSAVDSPTAPPPDNGATR